MTKATELFLSCVFLFWLAPMCVGLAVAGICHVVRKIKEARDAD